MVIDIFLIFWQRDDDEIIRVYVSLCYAANFVIELITEGYFFHKRSFDLIT